LTWASTPTGRADGWTRGDRLGAKKKGTGAPAKPQAIEPPFPVSRGWRGRQERRCAMFGLVPRKAIAPLARTERLFGWMPEFENLTRWAFGEPVEETTEWPYRFALTMEEKEKEVLVKAETPGFEPAEVKVEAMGGRLTIEAEHKEEVEKKEGKETKTETKTYAHVKRIVTLPLGVEPEKAEATYRNGVLEVHVPRKPGAEGRRIEVRA